VDNLVCSEWRGQEGRGKSSHDYEASNIMLSAASRIALLPVARSTRLWTATFTPRSTRARRLTTTVTTAHAYDTLPLSDAQRKTIYALSTPPGKSGIAVIRVSGPEALSVWQRMVRSARLGRANTARLPEPWKLERCHILDPHTSEILDEALAVFFRGAPAYRKSLPSSADERTRRRRRRAYTAPRSFTTEDVLELHVHGGRAVVGSVLAALARVPGCRPAAAGEFTRRAYEGGRLDLTQVEGLRDLIDADTESQRRAALRVARVGSRSCVNSLSTIT
jgi:tRNA modification GTPase